MGETDAIKEIENYLDYEGSVSIQAIATLYSLYQKEKEKNKRWEEVYDEDQEHILELNNKIFSLEEKNKIYWKLYQDEVNSKNDTWIEKTKITDLIEQLEDVLDLAEGEKNFPKYRKQALIEEIKDLQELLEERN